MAIESTKGGIEFFFLLLVLLRLMKLIAARCAGVGVDGLANGADDCSFGNSMDADEEFTRY